MSDADPIRLPVFPLPGTILLPGMVLPLHVFEPRYRALVSDVLSRDRLIGIVQPRDPRSAREMESPPLFDVGCIGRIVDVEVLDGGKYNIALEGTTRFRVAEELEVSTPFRQVAAVRVDETDPDDVALPAIVRADVERHARAFADAHGYMVDWTNVSKLDDVRLINGIAHVAPFDSGAKQALIEADTLADRAELICQLMAFYTHRDGDEATATLQ